MERCMPTNFAVTCTAFAATLFFAAAAPVMAQATADAAKNGYLVGSAHIAFPGIGHVRANGKGYAWVPVNYTVVR